MFIENVNIQHKALNTHENVMVLTPRFGVR